MVLIEQTRMYVDHQGLEFLYVRAFFLRLCNQWNQSTAVIAVAPLTWVSGNPLIFEQWVPEPINFGKKGL